MLSRLSERDFGELVSMCFGSETRNFGMDSMGYANLIELGLVRAITVVVKRPVFATLLHEVTELGEDLIRAVLRDDPEKVAKASQMFLDRVNPMVTEVLGKGLAQLPRYLASDIILYRQTALFVRSAYITVRSE